jgi:hypothetical protein
VKLSAVAEQEGEEHKAAAGSDVQRFVQQRRGEHDRGDDDRDPNPGDRARSA